MRTKEEVYEDCTRQELGNNPTGTRMEVVYRAMDEYFKERATDFLNWYMESTWESIDAGWYHNTANGEQVQVEQLFDLYLQETSKP